jgi:hypothetical protein
VGRLSVSFTPEYPMIYYKGAKGFLSPEQCEEQRVPIENYMEKQELNRGRTAISIESYCLPFDVFTFNKGNNETGTGTES